MSENSISIGILFVYDQVTVSREINYLTSSRKTSYVKRWKTKKLFFFIPGFPDILLIL